MTDGPRDQRSSISEAFEAYWRSLPREGTLPDYKDFDPLDIPDLLPHLIVFEVKRLPREMITIRFTGSLVDERTGFNSIGMDLQDFYGETENDFTFENVATMLRMPCGLVQYNDVRYEKTQSAHTEGTGFPMKSADAQIDYMVCVANWTSYTVEENVDTPMVIQRSDNFEWIDVGHGVPDR